MPPVLTVIYWRDIPAQVVAKDGRRSSKIVLHPRFQVAIDRAAVKAGRREMDAYIAEWRKEQRPCDDDLETVAHGEADRLEAQYTRDVLARLVESGGVDELAQDPTSSPAIEEPAP
ncbi:MAG TPA: virulence factor [Candidatus Limnocylindrales bacterium]